ncbi:MAG TPA: protein kinase [Pyrinomonadaceae bacterium]|nr:protein kinase [Pyrinomonadaceae bacterium]
MTPERWQQIDRLFHSALDHERAQRASFIAAACAGDQSMREEVESLLAAHEQAESFIEKSASDVAAEFLGSDQTRLRVGQKIGHYTITALLGAGGMGEVYLAQDMMLGRRIALKLLPEQFTIDAARVRRFEREARAVSALNHPNIVTIYEIGQENSTQFIVTEFVEGQTLRQRMAAGTINLRLALDVATQVAAALAAAHGADIVHRDIKPENVMLRNDGLIKVLDFGLAKRRPDPIIDSQAPRNFSVNTAPGVVMGTGPYMSPEQTRGLQVDARTDIWSLGVLLYEMVAGKVPFAGATPSDLIVSILDREPLSLSRDLPDVPLELQRIVSKALCKDREERYEVVESLLLDLQSLKQELEFQARLEHPTRPELSNKTVSREITVESAYKVGQQTGEVQKARTTLSLEVPNRKRLFWTAGLLGGFLVLAVVAWYLPHRTSDSTSTSLIAVPLTTDPGFEGTPSLSPDGKQVAFASGGPQNKNFDIYVKQIGGGRPQRLTSDPAVDEFPAWSPDGHSIAFIRFRGDKMEVLLIPSLGGPERKIAETVSDNSTFIFSWLPPYLSWSADSRYLVTTDRASPGEPLSLYVLSVATGQKRRLTTPPATALADGNPAVSPDGRTLAFIRVISDGTPQLYLLPLSEDYQPDGAERHLDVGQAWVVSPAWTADGQEIVCSASRRWGELRLWRVPVSGSEKPQPLASVGEACSQPTISRQGDRLIYAHWTMDQDIWRVEVSGRGRASPAVKLIASTRDDGDPQYSPDGSKIVFSSSRSGHGELWVCDHDGSNPVQLTSLESSSGSPRWFPDGRRIVFDSDKEGHSQIYVIDTVTLVPHRLTNELSDVVTPSVSRDGKWIYFASRRTGRLEVWRMPAEGGEAMQVTRKGGWRPMESPDGKMVYYLVPDPPDVYSPDVWKVPATGGEETRVLGPIGALAFALGAEGIYFVKIGTRVGVGSTGNSLNFFSLTNGTTKKVADVELNPQVGLSLSPDGRYVLFAQIDPFVSDLMLVENFR